MEPDEQPEALSSCPSFNSYSSDAFVQIAAKVTDEFTAESELSTNHGEEASNDEADDFEFSLTRSDEILCDGRIGQIFPVFNRDVLIRDDRSGDNKPDVSNLRISLKNLFIEKRESSSSSSEADELESIPEKTYCVWRPKLLEASPSICKKSNSTGSASKRWRIIDLLRRSNSDGKDSLVLLTPKNKNQKAAKIHGNENPKERRNSVDAVTVKSKAKGAVDTGAGEKVSASAHEVFYVRNRASKEGDKRKSYLPYRQDLVGFFANVNVGKSFPPF